jgi:hypothetical protein
MRSTRSEYMVMDVGVAGFFFGSDLDGEAHDSGTPRSAARSGRRSTLEILDGKDPASNQRYLPYMQRKSAVSGLDQNGE